jgi:hypothetical protein
MSNDNNLIVNYKTESMPDYMREVIETHLAIEAEDAKSAGALGFMARALVAATMPYKDPKTDVFKRVNGDFQLRIVAGYEGGIPFGIYPRLLMSWVSTEAVRKQSPVIELGDSLNMFLREVMDLRSYGGGARGSATRVNEQMKRLFGSLVSAQYNTQQDGRKKFVLKNVQIADELELDEGEITDKKLFGMNESSSTENPDATLWTPQPKEDAGRWKSQVRLTDRFFQEIVTSPVPIDLRAYKALRGSPLSMDIYTWLTYRMSYTHRKTRPIRWEPLMMQFGSGYNTANLDQAARDFKKAFTKALKSVMVVYPQVNVELDKNGLVLSPSPTHIPQTSRSPSQRSLFESSAISAGEKSKPN